MSKVDVKVFTIGNELMYAIRYLSTLKGGHGKKVWIEITQFCIKSTEGMDAFLYVRLCGLEKTWNNFDQMSEVPLRLSFVSLLSLKW